MSHARHPRSYFIMLLVLAAACSTGERTPASEQPAVASTDTAAVRRAIDSAGAQIDSAILRPDMAGITKYLANDYISLEEPGRLVQGRDAYRADLDKMAAAGKWTAIEYRRDGLDISGDLAVEYGRFSMTYVPTGKTPSPAGGNYIHVWRRQPDGSWRTIRDISNFAPQRSTPPTTKPAS